MQAKAAFEKTERENKSDQLTFKKIEGDLTGYRNRMENLTDRIKTSEEDKSKADK